MHDLEIKMFFQDGIKIFGHADLMSGFSINEAIGYDKNLENDGVILNFNDDDAFFRDKKVKLGTLRFTKVEISRVGTLLLSGYIKESRPEKIEDVMNYIIAVDTNTDGISTDLDLSITKTEFPDVSTINLGMPKNIIIGSVANSEGSLVGYKVSTNKYLIAEHHIQSVDKCYDWDNNEILPGRYTLENNAVDGYAYINFNSPPSTIDEFVYFDATGMYDGIATFTSSDSVFVNHDASFLVTDFVCCSMYIKPTNLSNKGEIFTKSTTTAKVDGYGAYYDAGNLYFYINSNLATSRAVTSFPSATYLNKWTKLLFRYNQEYGIIEIQINNAVVGTYAYNQTVNDLGDDFYGFNVGNSDAALDTLPCLMRCFHMRNDCHLYTPAEIIFRWYMGTGTHIIDYSRNLNSGIYNGPSSAAFWANRAAHSTNPAEIFRSFVEFYTTSFLNYEALDEAWETLDGRGYALGFAVDRQRVVIDIMQDLMLSSDAIIFTDQANRLSIKVLDWVDNEAIDWVTDVDILTYNEYELDEVLAEKVRRMSNYHYRRDHYESQPVDVGVGKYIKNLNMRYVVTDADSLDIASRTNVLFGEVPSVFVLNLRFSTCDCWKIGDTVWVKHKESTAREWRLMQIYRKSFDYNLETGFIEATVEGLDITPMTGAQTSPIILYSNVDSGAYELVSNDSEDSKNLGEV